MKLLISFLLITIIYSSCSDSPVSPVTDASNYSSKSNVIKTNEFLSNPDIVLNPGNIAEIKISDLRKLNSGNENITFKINYSPDVNQEYEIIKNSNLYDISLKNKTGEVLFNSANDFNNKILLNQNEIYSFEIDINDLSVYKPTDIIYISTKKAENSDNIVVDISLSACIACTFNNVKFDSDLGVIYFNNSQFNQCEFVYIDIFESSFKNTVFNQCTFQSVVITDCAFDFSLFNKLQFSSSSIGEKSILNNSKFVSANFFNSSFSSSSLERVSFTDAFLNGVFFESCQMPYVSFKKLMLLNVINDFTMNKVNFSNGSMIKYDASSSNLVNSNFTNANFSYTNLSGAEINGSTFNNTNLDFANLCGVTGKPAVFRDVSQAGTKCPIKP